MGSLSNLYISQSYKSLTHLGSDTALVPGTYNQLQDGLGNGLNIYFDGTNISSSGNIYGANITSSVINTGSFATTGSNTFIGNQIIVGNLTLGDAVQRTADLYADALTNYNVAITTDLQLNGTLTASLQEGYVWVGDNTGRTITVATSSFATLINTGSLLTTASFNAYTQSTNIRLNNLETTTASLNTSVSQLNSWSASAKVSLTNINSATQSLQGQLTTIGLQSGSWITESETGSFANATVFNSYTSSNDSKVNALINATASYANSASVSTTITNLSASLTVTDTFLQAQITALDASGSAASVAALNQFTASQLNINTGYNAFTSSAQISINNLNAATSSYANSASVAAVDAAQQTQINSLIAFTGSNTNTSLNAFTASQLNINSGYNTYTQSNDTKWSNLGSQSGSWITESETGSFARYDVSNPWSANQTFTNITATSASFQYVQTIFETASVIYSSGSNQLGDELTDIQTLSGSVKVQGSLTVNGTPVQTSSFDPSQLNQATASLFTSASLSLTTASISGQTLSFRKGDGTTFGIVINDVSGTISSSAQITALGFVSSSVTASSLVTASISGQTITFTKGNGTTFNLLMPTASYFTSSISVSGSITISGSLNNVDYIDFNTASVTPAWKSGRVFWDNTDGCLAVYNNEADVTLQVGQENWTRVFNGTGATILNGAAVRLSGTHGDVPEVVLAQSIAISGSANITNQILGIATHDIETGTYGYITTQGLVRGLNTNAFTDGATLYVSTSAGLLSTIPPPTPYEKIPIGQCVKASPGGSGIIYVAVEQPIDFSDLSSVTVGTYANGDMWYYSGSGVNGAWSHRQITDIGLVTTSSFNPFTASVNSATASLFTSASLALTTASFNTGTRNLTFTKGDATTFSVNIPDVSGSTGNFATTGSNSFNGNQTISGSLIQSGSNSIAVAPGGASVGTWIKNRVLISGPSTGETPRLYISGSDGAFTEFGRGFINQDTTKVSGLDAYIYTAADTTSAASNIVAVYNSDFSTDIELQMFANNSSIGFADWDNGSSFDYVPFMTLTPNNGDNPAPVFTRGLQVTGSLSINGNTTFTNINGNQSNVILGPNAMQNITGSVNLSLALGDGAMQYAINSANNVALGFNSLKYTSGSSNLAIGNSSLQYNKSGSSNVAVGIRALNGNLTGNNNTAIGQDAGTNNTTGSNNTYIGYSAAKNISGSNNLILGSYQGSGETINNNIILSDGQGNIAAQYSGSAWTLTGAVGITGEFKLASGTNKPAGVTSLSFDSGGNATFSNTLIKSTSVILIQPQSSTSGLTINLDGGPTTGQVVLKASAGSTSLAFHYLIINPT